MKPPLLFGTKGQAMIEMSITILFFLATLFVLGDLARIGYNWMILQYAVGEGARLGSLGKTDPACSEAQDVRSCSIDKKVKDVAHDLGVDDVDVEFGPAGAGGSLDFFTLVASRQLNVNNFTGLFFSIAGAHGGTYTIKAGTVVRNEPF